ncbi:MAG TPA: ADYC domain-containing protein [Polyangia bacterium]|nr:ADYC domain-containing protein [Polyangia bacterium]
MKWFARQLAWGLAWVLLVHVGGCGCFEDGELQLGLLSSAVRDAQGRNFAIIDYKCKHVWGYPYGGTLSACVAMGTADYYGVGQSNTLDGTPIDIYDVQGIHDISQEPPSTDPVFYFEAGWVPGTPIPGTKERTPGHAICLSKRRWATLPIAPPKGRTLPDPRLDERGRYCEDVGSRGARVIDLNRLDPIPDPAALTRLQQFGAVLYNRSGLLDTYLRQWSDGARFYASSSGEDAPRAGDPTPYYTPPAGTVGYVPFYRTPGVRESLEGVLFTEDAYKLLLQGQWPLVTPAPGATPQLALSPGALVELVTYQNPGAGGGYVTTTEAMPGYAKVRTEGYVFRHDPGPLPWMPAAFRGTPRPLYRFRKGSGASAVYLTSTTPQPGFQYDRMGLCGCAGNYQQCPIAEGYLLRTP